MEVESEGADFFPQKSAMDGARGPRCAEALLSMTTSGLAPYAAEVHVTRLQQINHYQAIVIGFCLD